MTLADEIRYRRYTARKREFARLLRLSPTPTEQQLWVWLRSRRLCGFKFRRQVAMGPYIVDFRCQECRLIVEVDGSSHNDRSEYDNERDHYFLEREYRVLHISTNEMEHNFSGVIGKIRRALLE